VTVTVRVKKAQVAEVYCATKSNGRRGKQRTQHKIAEIYFIHVDNKDIYRIFKTPCIISVLFTIKFYLFRFK